MVIGMNMTFGPMHVTGLQGQPRRMYHWTDERVGEGFFNIGFWNLIATIGSFTLAVGVLVFVINVIVSQRKHGPAPLDPWDARTLEWMTANPPVEHNFDRIPTVHHLDEYFHRKYEDRGTDGHHDLHQVATGEEVYAELNAQPDAHIHLPSPSYWPLLLALALPVMAYGVIYNTILIAVGALLAILALFGWGLEPHTATEADFDPPPPSPSSEGGAELEVATSE
jgi:cytochrome c oxidase subunit 1